MKHDFNCGTGSGGFEPGNSCAGGEGGGGGGGSGGSSSGGGASSGGKSGLPKNPKKVTIQQAAKAMADKGMKLGKSTWNAATKKTSYEVTDKDGNTRSMDTDQIKSAIYGG